MTQNTPDLTRFDGQQPGAVIRALKAEKFDIIGGGTDAVVMSRPDLDYVVRITSFATQAAAFDRLCRDNEASPFFPNVLDSHHSEGNPPVYITVTEKLLTLADLPENLRPTIGGWARALATAIEGHESHDAVHEQMLKTPELSSAALAMLEAMEERLAASDDTFIYYDSGFSENRGMSIEDWHPDNVLFRPTEGGGYQPVFNDPFREGFVASPERRAAFAEDLKSLRARLERFAPRPDSGPKETGPSPSRGPSL